MGSLPENRLFVYLTLSLSMLAATIYYLWSADNLCKRFGPRSGPTNVGPDLDPNHLVLKEFFEKVNF